MLASVAVTASAATGIKDLGYFSFAENAGTPTEARVLLRDGSVSGTILADIRIPASTSKEQWVPRLNFPLGLYVHVVTGTVRGAVHGTL